MADSSPLLGSIALFAGNFAPKGYAFCQGQLLSIQQNAALFSILGTTYGGNGVNNFALPDLRGRAPVQQGQGQGLENIILGESGGVQNVSILTINLPAHNHLINANNNAQDASTPGPTVVLSALGDPLSPTNFYSTKSPNTTMYPLALGPTGSNIPVSVQNPFTCLNYIIALQGIFPSRN